MMEFCKNEAQPTNVSDPKATIDREIITFLAFPSPPLK